VPVVSARIDPDRVLLLDADRFNNYQGREQAFSATAARGVAQWLLWAQNLMLTYGAFL
jgi:hypothetical protein